MAQKVFTYGVADKIVDGNLTIAVPLHAVPQNIAVTVTLTQIAVAAPYPTTADGLAILGLWEVSAQPPTALNLSEHLYAPLTGGRTEAQQQLRMQDESTGTGPKIPMPIGWHPLDDTDLGNGQTDGYAGYLPPDTSAPATGTTWVALVAL
jgi:hypothetical protein